MIRSSYITGKGICEQEISRLADNGISWFTSLVFPVPDGLKPEAWKMLAIFVWNHCRIYSSTYPNGGGSYPQYRRGRLLKLGKLPELLSGFSNTTIWLIVAAYMLSRGFTKTGLGQRVAYILIEKLGKNTLALGYAIMAGGICFCPATLPKCCTRRGDFFPIVRKRH